MNDNNVYTYTPDNLIHIVFASSMVGFFVSLNEFFLSGFSQTTGLSLLIASIFLVAGIFFRGEKIRKVFIAVIYINTGILAYISWVGGGLSDFAIMVFPVIIMLAALVGYRVHTTIVYLLVVSALAFLGLTTINGMNPHPSEEFNQLKILSVMVLFSFTGYIAFLFSKSYKSALNRLTSENDKSQNIKFKLESLARYDNLTKLLNRSAMSNEYTKLLEVTDLERNNLFLYFIDLDNFKLVNDNYNHSIGDQLLIEIAGRIKRMTNDGDIVCRLGGDEFIVVANRPCDFSNAEFGAGILKTVTRPFTLYSWEIDVTASIGMAVIPRDGTCFDVVCKKADLAMYKAKSLGRNAIYPYIPKLSEEEQRQQLILSNMKKAITNQSLELLFQPTINLRSGRIESAKTLIHWNDDNQLQAEPNEFMPIIEASEAAVGLGEWLVHEACRSCHNWHNAGYEGMRVAIRVSAIELGRPTFIELIKHTLNEYKLPPACLEIELEEHLLLGQTGEMPPQLDELKQLGVLLTIDNFATGYSNLGKLTHLNLDSLKLDKSFVQEFAHSHEHLVVVKAILSMAQILGLKSTAEAVDSTWKLQILKSLGCDYAQGDLWGAALTQHQVLQALKQESSESIKQKAPGILPVTNSFAPCP